MPPGGHTHIRPADLPRRLDRCEIPSRIPRPRSAGRGRQTSLNDGPLEHGVDGGRSKQNFSHPTLPRGKTAIGRSCLSSKRGHRSGSSRWRLEQEENSRKWAFSRKPEGDRIRFLRRGPTERHNYRYGIHFDSEGAPNWAQFESLAYVALLSLALSYSFYWLLR